MSDIWYSVSLSPRARASRRIKNRETPPLAISPLMDMVELPEGVCIYCNLPGIAPEDISLTITDTSLHIFAELHLPPIRGKIHALEFNDIVYEGNVKLPVTDAERIKASCSNGLLRVMLPFPVESGPVRIPVTAN